MTERFEVRPPELVTHARTVQTAADQITAAGAAGRAVRAGPESYGRLCTLVPAALGALQDVVIAAIDSAAAGLHTGGDRLRANSDGYQAADQRRDDAFRAIQGVDLRAAQGDALRAVEGAALRAAEGDTFRAIGGDAYRAVRGDR
ncbi:type VII secretion target [Actinoplanes derwentensis]|uniref:Excreted virulence factor EspC, type VII ESX diderm n=1 Tax=Actinoplanes derwentensis TaxID=113562 RepID=A0A1H2CGU9_9ACTN|nr:type VII secretion target [Actinoplanes derwentensis]GID88757.1 hypothetical protein Ade03nite_76810 [Actinoplanes derwentensis]SDT69549.1 Excreted virulence factor EspC, type VII ESX diderm [Actinoplanes derwentensis]